MDIILLYNLNLKLAMFPSGCGAYCDNIVGGVSTTGIGEAIMRIAMASRIIIYMEQGEIFIFLSFFLIKIY